MELKNMINTLNKLSKDELIKIIKTLSANMVIEPAYKIYTKKFAIEYLKKGISIYKRHKYKRFKIIILIYPFRVNSIELIKKRVRKGDIISRFDKCLTIILSDTNEIGALKVLDKIDNTLKLKGKIVSIEANDTLDNVLKRIEANSKLVCR